MDLFEDTTYLNASFVVALVNELKKCGALKVFGKTLKMDGWNSKVPIPTFIERCGSMWSDEFGILEKVLIKAASMLSKEFSLDQLYDSFPIKSVSRVAIQEIFEELLVEPHLFAKSGSKKYKFASSLTSRVFRKMTIPSHLEAIKKCLGGK